MGVVWINNVLLTKYDKYYFKKVLAPLLNAKMSDIVRSVDSNFDLSLPKKTQKHINLCHKKTVLYEINLQLSIDN